MAQITDLVQKLMRRAQILPLTDEVRDTFTEAFLEELVNDAVTEHNSNLTIDTMTQAEEVPVLLLAQIEVCLVRANAAAPKVPLKTNAAVAQPAYLNKSPYDNWMDMASKLYAKYTALCASLGLSSGVSDVVVVSTTFKKSDRLNEYLTRAVTPMVPPALLSAIADSGGEAEVSWVQPDMEIFEANFLFWSLMSGVHRVTNPRGCMTVPYISPSAKLADKSFTQDEKGIILTSLPTGMTVYLMLATRSINRKWTYSNEVVLVMP